MPKKPLLIIPVLLVCLILAPRMGRAVSFGGNLSNFSSVYAYRIGSFNISWSNILSTVKSRLRAGTELKLSAWCQSRMQYCDTTYAHSAAQCASKKTICLASPNGTAASCDQVFKTCKTKAAQTQTKCKKDASLDKRCWLVVTTKTCSGDKNRACTAVSGAKGTQAAISCNTQTGQWNWGDCIASVSTAPPPPSTACVPLPSETQTIACPAGQTGSITQQRVSSCPGPTWSAWSTVSNSCAAQTCQGTAPTCPSGYTGSYVCQNGTWVDQCVAPGQQTCTSWDYSAWGACSNGTQTRTVTAAYPSGCVGGNPVLSQPCTMQCQGSAPACGLGYIGSYVCQNGQWVNQCQVACTQPPPPCATGWSGNQSCMPMGGGNYIWMNTCVPPGPQLCYQHVRYILYTTPAGEQLAYVHCVGSGQNVNGQFCLLNDCGQYQPWNNYGKVADFKTHVDTILAPGYKSYISPTSCSQNAHVYSQCD